MKFWKTSIKATDAGVTPLVGVWIEIFLSVYTERDSASLPLWECGLKSIWTPCYVWLFQSLPLWECGLKYSLFTFCYLQGQSLPLWECGLKSEYRPVDSGTSRVTPLVGVWIEILQRRR